MPPSCARRPSRSRTSASTSTAAIDFLVARSAPRSPTSPPARRAGRLDDHDAARPQPLPRRRRRPSRARSRRRWSPSGSRSALEAVDPHRLPQHDPLRHRRRPDRRGRRGGVRAVLRPPGVAGHARPGALLAGLPQAPSDYNPFTHPGAARARRNEVLAADGALGYITPARRRPPSGKPLGAAAQQLLRQLARQLLPRLRQAGADRPLRRRDASPPAT